jgi:hypothetical protein
VALNVTFMTNKKKSRHFFFVFQRSIFINVGRGDVIDEQNIVNAIKYDSYQFLNKFFTINIQFFSRFYNLVIAFTLSITMKC